MPLTPLDIHNREFRRGFRGYDEDEVDEFLDEVVRDYEQVIKERDRLKDQVAELDHRLEQYRQLEDSLQKALLMAQRTSEEMIEQARKEAEMIVREAKLEADRLLQAARAEVRQVEETFLQRQNDLKLWQAKVRSLLESQLALLNHLDGEGSQPVGSV